MNSVVGAACIELRFIMRVVNLQDLLSRGVLQFAKQPPGNPEHLDFPRLVLPLIAHDYPAKTPAMWNAAYREFGMDAGNVILVGDPANAGLIYDVFRREPRYLGGGAGVGFKEAALQHLDDADSTAAISGSVNFVVKMPAARLRGYNTDGIGYAESLAAFMGESLRGKTALLLGAGGTARAVAFALSERGMRLIVTNRTVTRAEAIARQLGQAQAAGEEDLGRLLPEADVVINVSNKGAAGELESYSALAPAQLPATDENITRNQQESGALLKFLPRHAVVSDVVIAKNPTPLIRAASERGLRTLDGIPMVIHQAVEAFLILHGEEAMSRSVRKTDVIRVMADAAGMPQAAR